MLRAESPGADPAKDAETTALDGLLTTTTVRVPVSEAAATEAHFTVECSN